jgi:oxygen-independent coproporphyrinogen-3 oxidase
MSENNKSDMGRSLGLYVHVPFCAAKCGYCGFYSEIAEVSPQSSRRTRSDSGDCLKTDSECESVIATSASCRRWDEKGIRLVIDAMMKEMDGYDLSMVDTVYVGGGSPSSIPEGELARLLEYIGVGQKGVRSKMGSDPGKRKGQTPFCSKDHGQDAHATPEVEFTVEVNPGQVTFEKLRRMRELGVNRLSMGAQSFDELELAFLGRRHAVGDVVRSVAAAREAGFANISIDLIFAIPGADMASWKRSLEGAIRLGVEHISAYALTYEAGTPLYAAREEGQVQQVDEELDRGMYEMAIKMLGEAGLQQYEISNFARAGFECRHNHKYWANDEYVGIGPGAASWYGGVRWANEASIEQYVEGMGKKSEIRNPKPETISNNENANSQTKTGTVRVDEHRPSPKELACETAVLNLRRLRGIGLEEYKKRTGFDAMELFGDVVRRYEMAGMLKVDGGRVFLTREALPVADSVLCDFASVE